MWMKMHVEGWGFYRQVCWVPELGQSGLTSHDFYWKHKWIWKETNDDKLESKVRFTRAWVIHEWYLSVNRKQLKLDLVEIGRKKESGYTLINEKRWHDMSICHTDGDGVVIFWNISENKLRNMILQLLHCSRRLHRRDGGEDVLKT